MYRKQAFTLIELLVVIAVIAILMGILMPALSKVRKQARKQTCANQVRQHVLGLTMYGNEYDSKLPVGKAGNWIWDLNYKVVNMMLASGMTQEMFYCPSNPAMKSKKTMDWFWCGNNNRLNWDGRRLSVKGGSENVWAGYVFVIDTEKGRSDIKSDIRNEKKWLKRIDDKQPGRSELVCDAVLGQTASGASYPYGYKFTDITSGATYANTGVGDSSSHLKNEGEPLGGNIGFLDGHAEWRHFGSEPKTKSQAVREKASGVMQVRAGNNITFWW